MTSCPCCSSQMLRQIRSHEVHWFCRTCWTEMPSIKEGPNVLISLAEDLITYHQKALLCPLLRNLAY